MKVRIIKYLLVFTAFIVAATTSSYTNAGLTALEIVKKSEQHINASNVVAELKVKVSRPSWTKTMELKTWAKGTDLALAYVKAPDKDKGTVFLKTQDAVYNYVPKIKKVIKMPMNLLSQKWMGTDMTTDDLVKGTQFSSDYIPSLQGEETVSSRVSYKIKLLPKEDADVLWGRVDLWVDKTTYNQMKMNFYDEDLELVHTITGKNIKTMGGKQIVSNYVMIPVSKKGQKTELTYQSLDFAQKLSDSFFTKENMKKVRP